MARAGANGIPELVRLLGSRNRVRVDEARTRLILTGERAVPPLIAALDSGDTRRRIRVMRLLSLIRDVRGLGPLIGLLTDSSRRVRAAAFRDLACYPCTRSVRALSRRLAHETAPTVRVAAIHALLELYAAGCEAALSAPMRLLVDERQPSSVRAAAASLLRRLPRAEGASLGHRLENDADPQVRDAVSRAMRAVARQSSKPVDLGRWIERLGDEDYTVWSLAVDRLRDAGAEAVEPLVEAMRRQPLDLEYGARAAMVLKALGPRRCGGLARALDETEEPLPLTVLLDVTVALGQRSLIYRLKELIYRLAARPSDGDGFDPFRQVRARAHLELARIGSRVAASDLRRTLGCRELPLEPEFASAAEEIGTRREIPLLLDAWRRESPESRRRLARAIRRIVRRERIRRSDRFVVGLEEDQRRALERILPRKRLSPPRAVPSATV